MHDPDDLLDRLRELMDDWAACTDEVNDLMRYGPVPIDIEQRRLNLWKLRQLERRFSTYLTLGGDDAELVASIRELIHDMQK